MAERRVEVRTFQVVEECQVMGCYGTMTLTSEYNTPLSGPPDYRHHCTVCGKVARFPVKYPYIAYEEK